MGRQYGHAIKNGKVVAAKLPKGSEDDVKTIKTFGLLDSLRALKGPR
jgi:hypothetical protein